MPLPGSILICETPARASVTVALTETAVVVAYVALLLTDIVPVGAVPSTTIVSVSVRMLPDASRYWARTVLVPSPAGSVMAEEAAYEIQGP